MPSLPQSLIVRPVTPRVFSPQTWKTGMETRIKLPQSRRNQQSELTGEVLDDWRLTSVMPTYKKGRKEYRRNYRPFSLTSMLGKIMQQFVLSALTAHVKDN